MTYFNFFPKVDYVFGENTTTNQFTNLGAAVSVLDQIKDDSTLYQLYTVKDGERPDVVSYNLYGNPFLHWTFPFLNDKLREHWWPLSEKALLEKLSEDIPGDCLVFFGQKTGPDTGYTMHELVDAFPIGTNVYGSQSGASGVVYGRNLMLGQLFVRRTNNISFLRNETVTDTISQSPNYFAVCRIVHSPAYNAIAYVEDGDGNHIDVDYSSDFRGRGPENPSALGGVFGDDENPDIYADISPYNVVTYIEKYQSLNDDLKKIRVLKRDAASQITALFKKSMDI